MKLIKWRKTSKLYWCGMHKHGKHTRYPSLMLHLNLKALRPKKGEHFCRRCVKIKMQWASKK